MDYGRIGIGDCGRIRSRLKLDQSRGSWLPIWIAVFMIEQVESGQLCGRSEGILRAWVLSPLCAHGRVLVHFPL